MSELAVQMPEPENSLPLAPDDEAPQLQTVNSPEFPPTLRDITYEQLYKETVDIYPEVLAIRAAQRKWWQRIVHRLTYRASKF